MATPTSKYTNRLLDMIDEGAIQAEDVVRMCLCYMGENDVEGMMLANDLVEDEDEDEEEEA
ncbi:hypothetical protein UFOVP49_60 [uncultured Caudovirales phage]|uniref:Uncharacterized protein n=1 Tax=uncultured Caudovirales phage TaxID=2100421 RepID=A0A6J5KTJ4_9CAUD|nr:hypothetical protein UFOVP49_60 [uncultured Caudovirales phage]